MTRDPVVSSLYAMKYIVDNGLLPDEWSIRLIVGADEEEGLRCIDYYNEHAERMPDVSFVPDGYFPMVTVRRVVISTFHTIQARTVITQRMRLKQL